MKRVTILAAIGVLVAAVMTVGVLRLSGGGGRDGDRASAEGALEADTGGAGEEGEEEEGGPSAPADYLTLKFTSGKDVTQAQVDRSIRQAKAVPQGARGSWRLVGPTNVGGRITDLAVDPRQPDTVYTAASGGGVWKSTDAGDTYTPTWPTDVTQTIGALAIGPDGTLWAGTGEANPSGGGLTYFGDGVYKSTDGGASWQHWGLTDSAAVGRIAVDP